jgi:Thioredoxin.
MKLEAMTPNPVWVADAYAETVRTLRAHNNAVVYKIWGGDWCKHTRGQLPDFAAALEAADVPADRIEEHVVDENKQGAGVDRYNIERIPTVVIEHNGDSVGRYVEEDDQPIAVWAADQLADTIGGPADAEEAPEQPTDESG